MCVNIHICGYGNVHTYVCMYVFISAWNMALNTISELLSVAFFKELVEEEEEKILFM